MAFSLPLKSPVSPNTLPIVTRPMAMKPSASRLFNTNRFQTARLSSDVVFGPFSPTWTASQVHPSLTKRFRCASRGTGGGGGGKRCRSWGAKHTEDAVELRFELPWLGEEDVRVRVYEDLLMIRDVSVEESEDDEETAEPEMKGSTHWGQISLDQARMMLANKAWGMKDKAGQLTGAAA